MTFVIATLLISPVLVDVKKYTRATSHYQVFDTFFFFFVTRYSTLLFLCKIFTSL